MRYITQNLDSHNRKKEFSCGKEDLDKYLHQQAGQDIRRKLSACFVMTAPKNGLLKGYYTLSNNIIPLELVPDKFRKKLPKSYISIPATLIGRLAVDYRFQGKGIGRLLLIDALKRSYDASLKIGSFAVVVDPIDQEAETFYSAYGFINLPDSGKMFLPMKTISELFNGD
jgi:GNAT superfamily N-acetyltransferase